MAEDEAVDQAEDTFDMVGVVSSQIAAVGYNAKSGKLRVEFVNGDLYEYDGVPRVVAMNLQSEASPGSYFHSAVRNAGYSYTRIG